MSKKKDEPGALFIPAGACLGLGIGFFIGNIAGGVLVGVGLGFVGFAIVSIIQKKKI